MVDALDGPAHFDSRVLARSIVLVVHATAYNCSSRSAACTALLIIVSISRSRSVSGPDECRSIFLHSAALLCAPPCAPPDKFNGILRFPQGGAAVSCPYARLSSALLVASRCPSFSQPSPITRRLLLMMNTVRHHRQASPLMPEGHQGWRGNVRNNTNNIMTCNFIWQA